MFAIISNKLAQVDSTKYTLVGFVNKDEAFASVVTDCIFSSKSIEANKGDMSDQNCLYLTLAADATNEDGDIELLDVYAVYESIEDKEKFLEIKYSHKLGVIEMQLFFLVHIDDCDIYISKGYGSLDSVSSQEFLESDCIGI